jgi:predicted phage terminase large subunit-like protein
MTLDPSLFGQLLRQDLTSFIERAFYELNPQTPYLHSGHVSVMASKLEAVRRGEIRRLIINLPPRHLKSHCASIALPAWWLGLEPSLQIICASYGQDLSDKLARDCRTLMQSAWYQQVFGARLADRQAVHDFTTTAKGGRMSTSVGGVLTGRGADVIIIDDPLKPDEALSEPRRTAVNDWFDNTLLSRLNNKETGAIVIIMQRLHQDDLVGHVLEQGPWEVLRFPAIAEEDERHEIGGLLGEAPFTRRRGEPLHSARESSATLAAIRSAISDYNFQSQYMQSPTPVEGMLVKAGWLRYYEPSELPPRFTRIVQSWDTANKANELSDFSVCTTWGLFERRFYLLDVIRERLNFPELERRVRGQAALWPGCTILIEDKASGTQLIQTLQEERLWGVTAYKAPPGADKIMRLHAQTTLFENGLVYLPAQAPWLSDYLTELLSFPGSRKDDQVDSTTQALDHMRGPNTLEIWAKLAG